MPKMNIERSTVIDAPAETVYAILNDFNQWRPWSPWLITEPEAKVTVAEDAKSYEWVGKRTGTGNMSITDESENSAIDIDLNFLKPWKSKAKVRFRLEPKGEGTQVAWAMDSSLPFFMFWMTKMMTALIEMDYDRGLSMLKEYVEKGSVSSKLDFKGESDFPGCDYIGIKSSCSIDRMGEQMMSDFGKLKDYLDENADLQRGMAFSVYHKWDPAKNKVEYTGGWAVENLPDSVPDGLIKASIPATKIYTVSHVGSYPYLGNAWSALYAMHRAKEFKPRKRIHPFEVYVSDPQQVDEKDLITEINFAVV